MAAHVLPIPLVSQGERAFCLYACTSMVLKYFGIDKSMGDIASDVFLDAPGDVAVVAESAGAIAAYLTDCGLDARIFVGQDWDAIRKRLERGHALIAGVKAAPDHAIQDHAWVLRGFTDDANGQQIIFNNPWDDPDTANPVTYDPDADHTPGRTIDFATFDANHWSGGLPSKERVLIDVCYGGQGLPNQLDVRAAAIKMGSLFIYHTLRSWKAILGLRPFEGTVEGLLAGLAGAGQVAAGVQILGELIGSAGQWLIEKGSRRLGKKDLASKAEGLVLMAVGALVTAVGFVVGLVGGVVGSIVSALVAGVEAVVSVFSGASSDSAVMEIGGRVLDLGVLVSSEPWQVRWGDNWEDVSGMWSVFVRDQSTVDEITVEWEMEIGGIGLDNWALDRSLDCSGDLQSEGPTSSTNHFKRFSVTTRNTRGLRVNCWGRCKYGKDGAMTMVKMKVKATVTQRGQSGVFEEDAVIIGLST